MFRDMIIRLPPGQEKFVVIIDMKGYGYANNDVRAFIAGLSILQVSISSTLLYKYTN